MNLMGVSLGTFSICVGHRKVLNTLVRLVRWGDDFSLSGGHLEWTEIALQRIPR